MNNTTVNTRHSWLAERIFKIYLNRLFYKNFNTFRAMADLPDIDPESPLLLIPNHSTWWDGFFFFYLNQYWLRRKIFLMMLEDQLNKFPFFRKLGAFGVDPGNIARVKNTIEYSIHILNNQHAHNNVLCVFPQGELQPWEKRPVTFQKGIDLIIKKSDREITICPLAIRAEFLQEQKPDVFFLAGEPVKASVKDYPGFSYFAKKTESLLDQITKNIVSGHHGEIIFAGKKSVHERIQKRMRLLKLKSR